MGEGIRVFYVTAQVYSLVQEDLAALYHQPTAGLVQAGQSQRNAGGMPACLGHWGHLPGAAETILLGSLSLWGGGSRKQAGCINSQPNEYTKIAALLLLSSECRH